MQSRAPDITANPPILTAHAMIHIKDKGHFRKILQSLGNNKVLIVKYSTDWCGPCRIIAKSYSKLEKENQKKFGNVVFAEVCVFFFMPKF